MTDRIAHRLNVFTISTSIFNDVTSQCSDFLIISQRLPSAIHASPTFCGWSINFLRKAIHMNGKSIWPMFTFSCYAYVSMFRSKVHSHRANVKICTLEKGNWPCAVHKRHTPNSKWGEKYRAAIRARPANEAITLAETTDTHSLSSTHTGSAPKMALLAFESIRISKEMLQNVENRKKTVRTHFPSAQATDFEGIRDTRHIASAS